MVTGRYLSAFSPEVADYVRLRQPKTTIEMANVGQQYYDGKQAWRQFRSKPYECGGVSGLRGDGEREEPVLTNGDQQDEHHEYHSGQRSSNRGQRYGGSSVKQEPGRERDEKDSSVQSARRQQGQSIAKSLYSRPLPCNFHPIRIVGF